MSQLANRWATAQHSIDLVTWAGPESDRYYLQPSIKRHTLGLQSANTNLIAGLMANYRRVRSLRSKLHELNPNLILSFCDQMNIVALEAARSLKNTPVWIAEHSDPERQRLSRFWEAWRRRSYPRCTGCIALTQSIADYMSRWIPCDKLHVIPSTLQTLPRNLNYQDSGQPSDTLLYVGRLSPEKRVDLLLEAWRLANSKLPNWKLLIVGDGPSQTALKAQASHIPAVSFAGWVQQPETYFSSSQLFALSSSYEGFPVAMLEALSFGLPVITTACSSAISELQSKNYNEFLKVVVPDTASAFAEAIVELAMDPERRSCMSQQAQITASHFTWEKIGPLWDKILVH